jgi:predicted dinucleotide-utilizing enzyme
MIRVGLVGFGMAGRVFHAPLISSVDGLELAAVVERHTDEAAARYPGIKTYRSLEAMLADATLDLFVVATPTGSHFEVTRQILEAGKNVVVDKPVAVGSDEIAQLMTLATERKVMLCPFHESKAFARRLAGPAGACGDELGPLATDTAAGALAGAVSARRGHSAGSGNPHDRPIAGAVRISAGGGRGD